MERANVVCYMSDGTAHHMTLRVNEERGDIIRPFSGWKHDIYSRCSRAIWIDKRIYIKNHVGNRHDPVFLDFGQPDTQLKQELYRLFPNSLRSTW